MEDFWVSMGVNIVLTAINQAVKNSKKRASLKRALLKVRDQINMLYPEDTES
jgi:hypothetical protein